MNVTLLECQKFKNNFRWQKLQWLVSAAFHFSFFFKLKLNDIKLFISVSVLKFIYFELIVKLH